MATQSVTMFLHLVWETNVTLQYMHYQHDERRVLGAIHIFLR